MTVLPIEKPYSRVRVEHVPSDLRLIVRHKIAQVAELGNLAWTRPGREPMPLPTCSFDLRGRSAGQAISGQRQAERIWHIRINAENLLANKLFVLQEVVPRELAHLLVLYHFGKGLAPHGEEWQRVMRSLGCEPARTHAQPATPARVESRDYEYRCACRSHQLTARRHNKIAADKAAYACAGCGKRLVFISGPPAAKPLNLVGTRPLPPRAAASTTGTPPTEKQLALARALSVKFRANIPQAALSDKRALSEWLSRLLPDKKP